MNDDQFDVLIASLIMLQASVERVADLNVSLTYTEALAAARDRMREAKS